LARPGGEEADNGRFGGPPQRTLGYSGGGGSLWPPLSSPAPPPVPRTFAEYLRSLGPGLIAVLTWLGAGDVIDAGMAGGNYGYSLMWIIVVALAIRFLFVSLIAKYQLCNQRGEGVIEGLYRLNRFYGPGLLATCVLMGHIYGAYMAVGVGETWAKITGVGTTWMWALPWTALALVISFRPTYRALDLVFKVLLALLSISFIGGALWVGPDFGGIVKGTFTLSLPPQKGPFQSMELAVATIGAVGGSIMNLAYPTFIQQKGWRGPAYRRVQMYDFIVAVVVMIVLDLAVWTLGAELVPRTGRHISNLDDLAGLLAEVLGRGGRILFLLGFFAAVYTSVVGHAVGLGSIGAQAYALWKGQPATADQSRHPVYRILVVWVLLSPLVWTLPGMPDAVSLTILANTFQVVLIPFLAGGLWWITADRRYIGDAYRNRAWENLVMAVVFALAIWGTYGSVRSVASQLARLAG
jgi:Mn2+/Fe2+ NRAMP family transporter